MFCAWKFPVEISATTANGSIAADPVTSLNASHHNVVSEDVKSLGSRVVAYHFCQADNNSTCLVPEFVHSVAAQLCQAPQLTVYRQHVLTELNLQVRKRPASLEFCLL